LRVWCAADAQLPDLVELLVEREHFLQQRRRDLLRRFLGTLCREALEADEILEPRPWLAKRAVRVVQIRRAFEARAALLGRCVVEVIRVKLPTERAKALLQVGRFELQLSRETEERKIVAVASQRQELRTLRTEMDIDRGA